MNIPRFSAVSGTAERKEDRASAAEPAVAPCIGVSGKTGVAPHLLPSDIGDGAAELVVPRLLPSSMKDGAAEVAVFTGNLEKWYQNLPLGSISVLD